MSATISRSPFLRKRPINCPVLGEWTCFKRREDLMVLLADVARVNDSSLLKDYFSFSMNAFITLWSQVGYLLSSSEEDLIQNATKEHMRLLPYDDALEFITQHLMRPGKLLLSIFDPKFQGSRKPTTETITIEPLTDDGGVKLDDSNDSCERSPEVGMDHRTRLRAGSKRGALLNDSPGRDEERKKRKNGNSDLSDLYLQSVFISEGDPNSDESFLTFTKTFLRKKQLEQDRITKELEEEQQARRSAEERIKELEVQFKQQLEEERELRRAKEERVMALQDELQISKSEKQALEDKLQGIKQFLQLVPDKENVTPS